MYWKEIRTTFSNSFNFSVNYIYVSDDDDIPQGYERIPSDPGEDEKSESEESEAEVVDEKDSNEDKQEQVDIVAVKEAMQKLTLPPGSVPKWGAMLSDKDFLTAVRQTIQPKLDAAKAQSSETEQK